MGLDVYMVKTSIEEYDKFSELEYKEWKENRDKIYVELPSTKYPEHLFKVGYFRSSYNGNGFNSVVGEHDLPTLYDLFMPPQDEYFFLPEWDNVLARTKEAITKYASIEMQYGVSAFSTGFGESQTCLTQPRKQKL